MVVVTEGQVLYWHDMKPMLEAIQTKQVDQLIHIHERFRDGKGAPFKWGDEIELSLIKFDHANKKCYLLLKAEEFFEHIERLNESDDEKAPPELSECEFHNEYTSYIIETIPGRPNSDDLSAFAHIERNIQVRKRFIQKFLDKDEHVVSMTSFPLLGCPQFTWPPHQPAAVAGKYDSRFYSNDVIMKRELLRAATFNKIDRRGSLPLIHVPIFKDACTPSPFVEPELPEHLSKPDHIFMDHDGMYSRFSLISYLCKLHIANFNATI